MGEGWISDESREQHSQLGDGMFQGRWVRGTVMGICVFAKDFDKFRLEELVEIKRAYMF